MKPVRIKIGEMLGKNCVLSEDGEKLRDKITHHLNNGQDVILDFELEDEPGGIIVASGFLNTAFGQLLDKFHEDVLRERVKFLNVSPWTRKAIKMVVDNAKKFYEKKKKEKGE